ncbi:ABC transporter substrate-binding protein [Actinoplanes sp. SE50]|uniref:ABC transporter substrate-binding protein n=1 Tax=unclassified Actinoplanes TaxID=2626549 RepID=UPI00023ECBE3|nr:MULTISPECIES: extracellular solute-binding protein [unclassified Actinoplanes]AEV87723.1 sn-glycerol-3-phosphate-binding periplasmic protein ugpB [Actinoplanes sp. SE50/110]ATO86126.1 ABC transporter substrate-binding protein [Actinoplanes sp. SE50]SLM03540.1 ABC transporter substrate-binding protein [Actinoplanes sp. SE50/110]
MSAPQYRKAVAFALAAGLGLSLAACSTKSDDESTSADGKTTITVDCMPVGTEKELVANWNADVAAFEKANPNITIKSVSVGTQCNNPPDFTARLAGGTTTDVFYGYMTDLQQVLDSGQAMDITPYLTDENVPTWKDVDPALKQVFTDGGKTYALPIKNYSMGLVYNTVLFKKAGLDPANPPKTWAEVRAAAKKIVTADPAVAGYADYSAGNTGGWHFTAELYSQGGQILTADHKKADFNNAMGKQVLQNLKDMRYADNSMGSRQLLQWGDLLTNAAAGKVGMFIGAPDTTQQIVSQFKGRYSDWAVAPLPGQDGLAKATLGGGDGYFFKKGLTDAQIKAGLKWVAYEKLTVGKGQFDYPRAKPQNYPVGLPQPLLFTRDSATAKAEFDLRKANANVDPAIYSLFEAQQLPIKGEPTNAQAIYAVLDSAMSGVLTNPNADPGELLKTAEQKVDQLLAAGS